MNLWRSLSGTYQIEISSASISAALTVINEAEIHLSDVIYVDELTITGEVAAYAYERLSAMLEKRGDIVKIICKKGLLWKLSSLKNRPILVIGLTIFAFLSLYLPSRVLFIRVEGNMTIPSELIIEKAEECGVRFGVSRRHVRSEKVKNALLSAIPELKWTGVNTYGCIAVISVKERTMANNKDKQYGVASIVAKTDGVISSITSIRGTALCRAGQAVKKGQVLVSGYTDCGLTIKAEVAEAEIFARTHYNLQVVTPVTYQKTISLNPIRKRYYIKIGKKLINFSKDSGISSATCVKMYKENYLLLPGGFQLPLALVTEELTQRTFETETLTSDAGYSWLEEYSRNYLGSHLLAGEILQSNFIKNQSSEKFTLLGNFACREMIGQVRYEEIIDGNGKRN